ncbi:MAG: hypothetical protein ACK401_07480 [Archaeoglobaceae archaeon]
MKFLVFGLILIALAMAFQLNSDFNSYYAERENRNAVVEPKDAYIGYTCENVRITIRCGSDVWEGTILRIYNNMNESIHATVSLTEEIDGIEIKNGEFDLAPSSMKEIVARVSLPAGVYYVQFTISAEFENGSAEILTVCSSEILVENVTKPKISKTLLSGKTVVKTHTKETWTFVISVENPKENSTVKDVIPGEFNIVSYSATAGSVSITTTGKAKHISWTLSESGDLTITIETALNPAGKREFTSPGRYYLNEGAELDGVKTSPIIVYAICK